MVLKFLCRKKVNLVRFFSQNPMTRMFHFIGRLSETNIMGNCTLRSSVIIGELFET